MYQMIVLPPFSPSPLPLLSSLSLLSSHPRRSGANTSSLALARLLTVMDYLMFQFSGESTQHFEQLTEQVCGVAAAVYVPLQWACLVPLQWACLEPLQWACLVAVQWACLVPLQWACLVPLQWACLVAVQWACLVPLQWACLVPLQWACLVAVQCGRCVQSQWCE